MLSPVERTPHAVRMIDQRKLPLVECYLDCTDVDQVVHAIREMVVRGAPAIGIAAAHGLALEAQRVQQLDSARFDAHLIESARRLVDARPTAINLAWAVRLLQRQAAEVRARRGDNAAVVAVLAQTAARIQREDLESCLAMGRHGGALLPDGARVLTHCNAGGLATAGYGTALGVVRGAVDAGKKIRVLANETRPLLQGARLTAWELMKDNIETILISDSSAGSLMQSGEIDLVVVGSDRIAANGDVANKIGTYSVAVLAHAHALPFYVAAPMSTVDFDCANGGAIPIEERDGREVTEPFGVRIAPPNVGVRNMAFDVTPARYVTAIITEKGVARPPFQGSLARMRTQ